MEIKVANEHDASIIHQIMMKAFMRYKDDEYPSSALEERIESIREAMLNGEQALISYVDEKTVGMVRFRQTVKEIYFYRLAVIPTEQGKGYAKKILAYLENYARKNGVKIICCDVRKSEKSNMNLYRSIGFEVTGESYVEKENGKLQIVSMRKLL